MDYRQILDFWLGELADGFASVTKRKQWFEASDGLDQQIRDLFAGTLQDIANGSHKDWLVKPKSRLAYIIVCDQFSRNIHRGSDKAFATDEIALEVSREGIQQGFDQELAIDEKCFFYLPFEHSEDVVDQHAVVGLYSQLRDETPQGNKHITGNYLRFGQIHRDIIQKFGRFPHRNQVLGRESTAAELEHIATGQNFGQPGS